MRNFAIRNFAMGFCAAILSVLTVFLVSAPASAGEADIVNAIAEFDRGTWRFDVTVAHADTGWEHYADAYEVVAPDGTVLSRRVLTHPHVNEQPFTRSVGGVTIPPGISFVVVRGHDLVHGFGGREFQVELPQRPDTKS